MVITVESGNFDCPRGKADELFCNTTKNPAIYHFEKMISGAYLGSFASFLIHRAMDEHLFSPDFCTRFRKEGDVNTTEMSHYLEMPFNSDYKLVRCVHDRRDDALTLYAIIDAVIERAGKQTAANLASTILKSGAGLDPRRPVCINADGTTFYKTAH
jgi:hexokinase